MGCATDIAGHAYGVPTLWVLIPNHYDRAGLSLKTPLGGLFHYGTARPDPLPHSVPRMPGRTGPRAGARSTNLIHWATSCRNGSIQK